MKITQANSYCNNINTTLEKNTFLLHTFSKLQTLLPRLLRSRLLFLPKTVDGTPLCSLFPSPIPSQNCG